MQLYERNKTTVSEVRLTPPSFADPWLLSAVLSLQQRSSSSQRNSNSFAVAMAPTKEPGGIDNLAFDVSAITHLCKNKHSSDMFSYFYMIVLRYACKKQTTTRKDGVHSVWNFIFCCMVPLQMDKETKDKLEGRKDQPRQSSCASAEDRNQLAYCVTDVPPWYLCIVLSVQVCACADVLGIFGLLSVFQENLRVCTLLYEQRC